MKRSPRWGNPAVGIFVVFDTPANLAGTLLLNTFGIPGVARQKAGNQMGKHYSSLGNKNCESVNLRLLFPICKLFSTRWSGGVP
jgi:hypothetical protein